MKRLIIYTAIISGLVSVNSSCKKYVDIDPPRSFLNEALVFTDDKTANSAVVGLYANLNSYTSSFINTDGNFYPSFSADDLMPYTSSTASDEFTENELTIGNGNISGFWSELYSSIFHANSIIEGLNESSTLTPAKATQLMGEAKFLRAFFYFYLVNYFGDVPLITNTNFIENTSLPRTSADIVYDTIINDLLVAQTSLPDEYITGMERTRVNKGAANALLARVYLYRGVWDKAEAAATAVINDPKYSLPDPSEVFLKTSGEAIWQMQAVNTVTGAINSWEGYSIVPDLTNPNSTPGYLLYSDFPASFEANDKRAASWINTYQPLNGGPEVYYPYKYKVRVGSPVTEYSTVMRAAEQYLIRAEARAQQNNLDGATADVDSIRSRADIPFLSSGLSKEQLLLAIENERRLELFTEWGHRWFDLRRTGRALAVLGPKKPGLTEKDLYYPIPLDARLTNTNLTQNNGYN